MPGYHRSVPSGQVRHVLERDIAAERAPTRKTEICVICVICGYFLFLWGYLQPPINLL
jgi:hypothetical protein